MAVYASWSPGIAVMPAEFPGGGLQDVNGVGFTGLLGLRQSGGTTFKGQAGNSNWFHVPIATPVIINDVRAKLLQVFIMFQCGDPTATIATAAGANVTDIHVWDGGHRIHKFGGFNLFGEHRFKLDTSNTMKMPNPIQDVIFGIEIAVHVNFSADQSITFAGAGADFVV